MEQLLPINLKGANGLLPLGRNQPVRKARCNADIRSLGRSFAICVASVPSAAEQPKS
jgi:hypothetical protein